MYEERITALNAGLAAHANKLTQFLQLADFLYKDLGLIGEVHSKIDGEEITYSLHLIDRPSTSVQIRKVINEDGTQTEWEAVDLTDLAKQTSVPQPEPEPIPVINPDELAPDFEPV